MKKEIPITIDCNSNILVTCAYSVVGHTSVGDVSWSWHISLEPYSWGVTITHLYIILKQLISMYIRFTISWAGDTDDITLTDLWIIYHQLDILWFAWTKKKEKMFTCNMNWPVIRTSLREHFHSCRLQGYKKTWALACLQKCLTRASDVCESRSLIVFQYPTVSPDYWKSAVICRLAVCIVKNWLWLAINTKMLDICNLCGVMQNTFGGFFIDIFQLCFAF